MARVRSMPLGNLLYWRLDRGYMQEQLAKRISMRPNTVWRIEAGYPAVNGRSNVGSSANLILLANSCDQMAMSRANFEWRVLELGVSVSQASMR
jgi:DNA-binding XRE family transcriptional regulator